MSATIISAPPARSAPSVRSAFADKELYAGNGYVMLIIGGPKGIAIDHNTIVQEHGSGLIQLEGLEPDGRASCLEAPQPSARRGWRESLTPLIGVA